MLYYVSGLDLDLVQYGAPHQSSITLMYLRRFNHYGLIAKRKLAMLLGLLLTNL